MKTINGLKYSINDEGCVNIYGAKTLKRYRELKNKRSETDCYKYHCFYAFSKEQFEEGKQKAGIKDDEKIQFVRGIGLYGTHDGIKAFTSEVMSYDGRIKAECNPQEVYFHEYNNFECCWSGDDSEPMNIIRRIWGEEIAKTIVRI